MKRKERTALRLRRYKNHYEEGNSGHFFVLLVDRTGSAEIYVLSKKIGFHTRPICVCVGEGCLIYFILLFFILCLLVCACVFNGL